MFLEIFGPCIAASYACATVCDRCAVACLADDNPDDMARCISLTMDCAQICRAAAALMARHSEFVDTVSEVCADLCSACAIECGHHEARYCRQCAEACSRCAKLCREIARQPYGGAEALA